MTFAQRLQELRKGAGLSQEELAERLGVSRQSVSKWELGQAYPETEKIIEISRMFGVSLDVLLKGEEPPASAGSPEKPAPSPSCSPLLTVLGILAILIVAVMAFIFVFSYSSGNSHTDSVKEPAPGSSEPVTFPEEITPPVESAPTEPEPTEAPSTDIPPVETAPPTAATEDGPADMAALREYYFDFARQYRLDYLPYFEEYLPPFDSTEYLFWAFAVNLDNWGEDKGTMSREYVDEMVLRHFGQRQLEHQSMFKCWNYDGEVYTAIPGGIKEQPLYLLTGYATWEENGIRYHEITLDYLLLTSGMIPTPEEDAALRACIISGSTNDLYPLDRVTLRYHMDVTNPDIPVFDCYTLLSEDA